MDKPTIETDFGGTHEEMSCRLQGLFLHELLKARIELHLESEPRGYDREVNIYLASLLESLVHSGLLCIDKDYLSPFDLDVRAYLDAHPGLRNEYVVYKENADFGLMMTSVFLKFRHRGSYHRIVLGDRDPKPRISLYYRSAAGALAHLRGGDETLVHVLDTLASRIEIVNAVVRKVAGDFLGLIERISPGSLFHLEKTLARQAEMKIYDETLDDFLQCFADHREHPTTESLKLLREKAACLHRLNPDFVFNEESLPRPPGPKDSDKKL